MGEQIQRITIDGQQLFNEHVGLALENIRADDVEDVRVFKTTDDRDEMDEGTIRPPILVADVRTKSKPMMIRQVTLAAGGGSGLDSEHQAGELQGLYEASARQIASRVGETLSTNGSGSNVQRNPTGFGAIKGDLMYTLEESAKFKLSSDLIVEHGKDTRESWTIREYFPSELYDTRHYRTQVASVEKRINISSRHEFRRMLAHNQGIQAGASIRYSRTSNDRHQLQSQSQAGSVLQHQDMSRHHRSAPLQVLADVGYSGMRIGRARLTTSVHTEISDSKGYEDRIDTLSGSTSPIALESQRTGWSRTYGGRLSGGMKVTSLASLSLTNRLTRVNSLARRRAVDLLTGQIDPVNTYDHRINELNNNLSASLNYINMSNPKGFSMAIVHVSWEYKNLLHDELAPRNVQFPKSFHLLGASALLEYQLGGFNSLKLRYTRLPKAGSWTDYMPLDNSNPLVLQAGNLGLKKTATNMLVLDGAWVQGAGTIELEAEFETEENTIVRKEHYFSEATYLAQYDYWAPAGSSLITSENLSGRWRMGFGASHSIRSGALYMNMRSGLSYRYSRYPGFLNTQEVMRVTHQYQARLNLVSNFSSRFVPSLKAAAHYSDRHAVGIRHRWFEPTLDVNVRAMLFRSVELNSFNHIRWYARWPEIPGMQRFSYIANLSVGYLFDERGNLRLTAQINDLLNRRSRVSYSMDDEYVSESYEHFLGRSGMIRLEYRF